MARSSPAGRGSRGEPGHRPARQAGDPRPDPAPEALGGAIARAATRARRGAASGSCCAPPAPSAGTGLTCRAARAGAQRRAARGDPHRLRPRPGGHRDRGARASAAYGDAVARRPADPAPRGRGCPRAGAPSPSKRLRARATAASRVAITDPSEDVVAKLEAALGCARSSRGSPTRRRWTSSCAAYTQTQTPTRCPRTLREEVPELSAYRTSPSKAQTLVACVLGFMLAFGLLADLLLTATVLVGDRDGVLRRSPPASASTRPGRAAGPARRSTRATTRTGGTGRAGAARLHDPPAALQGEAGDHPGAVRGAVGDRLPQAQARRAAADRGRRRPDEHRDREVRPASVDAPAPAPGRGAAHEAAGDGHRVAIRPGHARDRLRRGGQAGPAAAQEGGLGLPAGRRLGGVPAGEARLLQPASEPADPLVHARVRRLVQHLPAGPAPHRRADPARGHVEPLPARTARGVSRVGSLQRHRGRRPRAAICAARADDGHARVHHGRGGQQPGRQLAAPALTLEQGLHADPPGPHPAAAAGCCGSSARGPRPASSSPSAAPS